MRRHAMHATPYLRKEVAGTVDDLGLPHETVRAVNKPHQLYDALNSVQVAQILCETGQYPRQSDKATARTSRG